MRYKCASMSISEGGGVCVSLSAGDPETVTMTGCESVCTIVTRCSSGSFSCSGLGNASMVLSTYLRSMGVMVGRLSLTVTGGSARGARYDGGPLYSEPHHAAPVDPLTRLAELDLYVGGGDTAGALLSNRSNLSLYSCIEA